MKTTFRKALLFGVVAVISGGCTFIVISPAPMQTGSQDFMIDAVSGQIIIEVLFSNNVDLDSLVPGANIVIVTETNANAGATVAAGANASEIVITTDDAAGVLCNFDPDCFFTLNLIGSGTSPIRNVDGDALDGDADETAGGDYTTTFLILG